MDGGESGDGGAASGDIEVTFVCDGEKVVVVEEVVVQLVTNETLDFALCYTIDLNAV